MVGSDLPVPLGAELMRQACCSFVIPKLNVGSESLLLFRIDPKWFDISLVGGHVDPKDEGSWLRTAIRETEEELAPLKHKQHFDLQEFTPELRLDAEWSKVREKVTNYRFHYFSVLFPEELGEILKYLAKNPLLTWVREKELAGEIRHPRLSAPIRVLLGYLQGRLDLIPVSWPGVVERSARYAPSPRHLEHSRLARF